VSGQSLVSELSPKHGVALFKAVTTFDENNQKSSKFQLIKQADLYDEDPSLKDQMKLSKTKYKQLV